jgi:hypothetical protein
MKALSMPGSWNVTLAEVELQRYLAEVRKADRPVRERRPSAARWRMKCP